MSVKVPNDVRNKVAEIVFAMADQHNYLTKGRVENGVFMDMLVKRTDVGGALSQYMAKDKIKTYIKDGLLNRYSKVRRAIPRGINAELKQIFGDNIEELDYVERDQVSLHKCSEDTLLVAARTNYLKWETGLRKLILYVANSKGLPPKDGKELRYALLIFQNNNPVNTGEKKLVNKALKNIGVECVWT